MLENDPPIGTRVKFLRNVKKAKKDDHAILVRPMRKNQIEEEKDYNFTLSSFMYTDADSLEGNLTAEMAINYYTTEASLYYDFGKDKFSLNLTNGKINEMCGMDIGLMLINEKEGETRGLVKLTMKF